MPPDRRAFLRTAGTAAAAVLAGRESLVGDVTAAATDAPPPATGPATNADDGAASVVLPVIPPGF